MQTLQAKAVEAWMKDGSVVFTQEEVNAIKLAVPDMLSSAYLMAETRPHDVHWHDHLKVVKVIAEKLGITNV